MSMKHHTPVIIPLERRCLASWVFAIRPAMSDMLAPLAAQGDTLIDDFYAIVIL